MNEQPVAKLELIGILDGSPDWPVCEDQHFEPTFDRPIPLELRCHFGANDLDDLDYWSKAVASGWHSEAETQTHIMALARAVPKLTAELRRLRGEP